MASDADICNLALSAYLGESASVVSIVSPTSVREGDCALFYPIARRLALELHDWRFASTRTDLALTTYAVDQWPFSYVLPSDFIRALRVYHKDDTTDEALTDPAPFIIETYDSGQYVLLTTQEEAALRYTRDTTDTSKFTPLFVDGFAAMLASYLAGSVVKGSEGIKLGAQLRQQAVQMLSVAAVSEARQARASNTANVGYTRYRG